ncbi:hypothetical protein [Nitrosospira sp. Nsp1]|uniref:hypothetical protein n=1 Tax=Nitrosospira sp. Nsp1 TaxID=136547 RepID=UPI00087E512D|nr:hypothetical protein [Nitrosospira sp. Nsp1]SCX40325.1 hypothetical protein SAMN05720354_10390 [Nitrosospira sp. Nsp1]
MNEYARATGRELRSPEALSHQNEEKQRALRPLSELEQAHAAENRRLVRTHMPELIPEIRELAELGLIDGWRNVMSIEILKKGTS